MASPLNTLRRYQFAFFVFFGVLLMIVFVAGDPLYSWLGGGGGGGGGRQTDETVVAWRGNQMTESEIYNERVVRNIVQEFINAVLEETRKKNGTPQVQQRLSLIPSEREIVYTKVLATRAEQIGLEVTDETALQYLEKLSADLIPRGEIGRIFRETIGNRISEQQAMNTIKTELAAQNYIALTYPDLTRGYLPAQAWEYFRRLNRRVKAEIVPLTVADFKKKVSKEPTQSEVQALYDSAKERYPEPALPDPGFKRRRKVAFDFVRADRKKFEDEEFAKLRPQVTDQEVTEYYDKNKEEFRETTAEQPKSEGTLPGTTLPGTTLPGTTAPSAEKPEADPTKPDDSEKKSDGATNPAVEKPSDASAPSPSEKTDSTTEPAAQPADNTAEPSAKPAEPGSTAEPKVESGEPNPSEPKPSEAKAGDDAAKGDAPNPGSCQEESAKEQDKSSDKSATEEPADAPKPDSEKAAEEPAKPADAEKPKDVEEPKDAEEPKVSPPVEPSKPAEPAAEKPATTDVPAAPEKPKSDAPPATPAPKYRPLDDKLREEVRDRVARPKATRAAQDRVDTVLNEIRRMVAKYAQQKRSAELKKLKAPEPLSLEKIALGRGIEAGHIPLSDSIEVQNFELGKTFEFDFSTMQMQRIPFDALAYRDNVPLLKPEEIRGDKFEVHFLYWKTEEKEPFVPELKDIHAEVVDAWKQREALTIAQAEAKSLVEKARAAAGSLADSLGKQDNLKVTDTNEFSWLTSGSVPMGMGMPALSSVDGAEFAGQEFMRSVMSLKAGDFGTAVNQPHTVVYVVRIVSEAPPDEALREMFLQTGASMELMQVARMERDEIRRNWIEQIEREMNLKWQRDPQS